MSLTITETNTATDPVTPARSLVPQPINYEADYRVVSEAANEAVLVCMQSPVTRSETIRFAFSEVADVFKGVKIEAPVSGNRKGCSVLVQLAGTGVDGNVVAWPYSAHLVLKVPYGAEPTADDVKVILQRLLGHIYDTGSGTLNTRVESLIRGAVVPVDL